ncbi:metallophosphoesterase family protein [Desulfosarcina cetonica]|uniref:metallophosphoesterase family protein n=1 Tax=Desulfosarcina cetonica TaxID=90730 RepID=UPI0030EF507D
MDEAVDFVLIAGDLFDSDWRDYNTGLYFMGQMRRLGEAGIAVFIVAGNHDAAGRMTRSLPCPSNVHIFSSARPETRQLEPLRVAIHGQSFAKAAVTDNLAVNYPEPVPGYFNIGLLHTSLTGRQGHENYAPCALDDLVNKGYDYWALGHVHQAEIVATDPPVVFPGCIQGRHIREVGEKGCMVVVREADGAPQITPQALDVIRWEHLAVDLTGVETLDDGLTRFRQRFQECLEANDPLPVIARLTLIGQTHMHTRITADVDHLKQSLRAAALSAFGERTWIEKVRINTRPVTQTAVDAGPLHELDLLVARLKASPEALLDLGAELTPLFQKLPAAYRQGEACIRPDDPETIAGLVARAHAMLLQRLNRKAGPA